MPLGVLQFLDQSLQGDDSAFVSAQLVGDTVVGNGTINDVVVVSKGAEHFFRDYLLRIAPTPRSSRDR